MKHYFTVGGSAATVDVYGALWSVPAASTWHSTWTATLKERFWTETMYHLNHGSVPVLLDIAHNLDGHIVLVLSVPALQHASKSACSTPLAM